VDPCHFLIPAQHCWAHGDIFIVVGVKKVPHFTPGKMKKVKVMMMLVWESSNSKWGIWAVVVDKNVT